jgi:hypothetical protein
MSAPLERRYRRAGLWTLALTLALALTLTLAALTRPINRQLLPRSLEQLRPALRDQHQGAAPCLRWSQAGPLSDREATAFLTDWERSFAADLHLLLPWLSWLRARNRDQARRHHALAPYEEARQAALARLSGLDRLRLRLRPDTERVEELIPFLQHLAARAHRERRDLARQQRLLPHLSAQQVEQLEALGQRWGARLATRQAQGSLLDQVALRVTLARMDALERGLRSWRGHYGAMPTTFQQLAEHLESTGRMDPTLRRGWEADGSLRDGWLRPMTYYPVGSRGYHLSSQGPSTGTEADDLVRDTRR